MAQPLLPVPILSLARSLALSLSLSLSLSRVCVSSMVLMPRYLLHPKISMFAHHSTIGRASTRRDIQIPQGMPNNDTTSRTLLILPRSLGTPCLHQENHRTRRARLWQPQQHQCLVHLRQYAPCHPPLRSHTIWHNHSHVHVFRSQTTLIATT